MVPTQETTSAPASARPAIARWGRLSYEEALERQIRTAAERRAGRCGDLVVAVEHPPTVTLGRHAPAGDILLDQRLLADRGIALVRSDRGGRATYHGPGQAVVYPIVAIGELGLGVRAWVELLERALLATLKEHGIAGRLIAGQPGVWTERGKIASIGLRIAEGISYHGVSLNVGLDVSGFDCIVACGVPGQKVTSIAAESATVPSLEELSERLCRTIADEIERLALARRAA